MIMTDTEHIMEKLTSELELLERHILMLKFTKENEPIGIIRLSELIKMPKHKVRYSLRLLEQAGLIEPSSEGAKIAGGYDEFMRTAERFLDELTERITLVKDVIPRT